MVMASTAAVASSPSQAAMVDDIHFADAEDRAAVILGKQLYRVHCAGCHCRNLQGQPLWQLADSYAGRRAPAFDETRVATFRRRDLSRDQIRPARFRAAWRHAGIRASAGGLPDPRRHRLYQGALAGRPARIAGDAQPGSCRDAVGGKGWRLAIAAELQRRIAAQRSRGGTIETFGGKPAGSYAPCRAGRPRGLIELAMPGVAEGHPVIRHRA